MADQGWVLFDHDDISGVTTYLRFEGRRIHVRKVALVDETLSMNAEQRADEAGTPWGDGKNVARVPLNVFYKHLAQPIAQGDDAYVKRWLNDSDHRDWRTREGQV